MCTSLIYTDLEGRTYQGRTMELQMELPYEVAYLPPGTAFRSLTNDGSVLEFRGDHGMLAVAMRDPTHASEGFATGAFSVVDGQNDAGLAFSLLAYPNEVGPRTKPDMTRAVLNAVDLGSWSLAQFATVEGVKAALADQPVVLEPAKQFGGALPPFHFVLCDRSGASLVVEFKAGTVQLYDNPVGVMTNGPEFSWHLTNLGNYAHLSNAVDQAGQFNGYAVHQPDPGAETAGLPGSDTAVGRFVRAAYYASFTEKAADPDEAVLATAHIMNKFDRPKGISEARGGSFESLDLGPGIPTQSTPTEYTSWTKISDLERGRLYLRTYFGLNYSCFDLTVLAAQSAPCLMGLPQIDRLAAFDLSDALAEGHA